MISFRLERETGIEPAYTAWKAIVLPLNYSRKFGRDYKNRTHFIGFGDQGTANIPNPYFLITRYFNCFLQNPNLTYCNIAVSIFNGASGSNRTAIPRLQGGTSTIKATEAINLLTYLRLNDPYLIQ